MGGTERMSVGQFRKMVLGTIGAGTVARGQTAPGVMNKTEARYAQILDARRALGEIVWWKYEAIKVKLAEKTFLTVDFFVMLAGGDLECHEVKGMMREDAAVKLKVAASMFPFRFYLVRERRAKLGGGFTVTEVPSGR